MKITSKIFFSFLLFTFSSLVFGQTNQGAAKLDSLHIQPSTKQGFPVLGAKNDTLFYLYSKIGASLPKERALNISRKIKILYNDDFLKTDSILVLKSDLTYDIVYGEIILMSISENDANDYGKSLLDVTKDFKSSILTSILEAKKDNSIFKILLRIGLVILVLIIAWVVVLYIGKGYTRLLRLIATKKDTWLKDLTYKDYTLVTVEQELKMLLFFVRIMRWLVFAILLYITLPIIFSIFPFSRNWATVLFSLVWSPLKGVLIAIWKYIPNLFSIIVIFMVMRYFIRFIQYVFKELESEKLSIGGFHPDWARTTFTIVRFLLYAFMFVLIFQYLPYSDSNIFKGVSVFIGVLFSFGSSSAISNIFAGLVITYMRPFKENDRIKIGEVTGDVIEKSLLVTRIRTAKNEVITIPNSAVLSSNTINYTIEANKDGLIVNTTVTIGYDVAWVKIHKALIEAALKTEFILSTPMPFVYQTSLDDFYVSYQINAYTHEASKQASIYSDLHQNILDTFFAHGIEIMSPHYRAERDGNKVAIPD